MKIETQEDIKTAKNEYCLDLTDELEIGCEIWDVHFEIDRKVVAGEMARWPDDRGAFAVDSSADWGDWKSPPECCEYECDYLLIDNDGDPGWEARWIDPCGDEWREVRIDDGFELPEGESYWWELEQVKPTLKAKFDAKNRLMITLEDYSDMEKIKGWGDGPDHAPNPIKLV